MFKHFLILSLIAAFGNISNAKNTPLTNLTPLSGTVIGISDGDTLKLLDANFLQHKIRLAFIDAPEKAQPFGEAAKKSLAEIAYSRQAKAYCPSQDRYGRNVCEVIIEGRSVNTQQVERGMAWVYTAYAPKNSPLLLSQEKAKSDKVGLWQDSDPIPPWNFRKKDKTVKP